MSADSLARLRLLYELGCAFAARTEIEELFPLVVGNCRDVLDAEAASVLLLDPTSDELYFPFAAEDDPERRRTLEQLRFPASAGIAGEVLRTGRPLRIDDPASDPRFFRGVDRSSGATTRSLLAAPLRGRDASIGVLEVINRRGGGPFSDEDLTFLETLAASVAVAIENAQLYAEIKRSERLLRTEVGLLRRDLARRDGFAEIVGVSAPMREVLRLMESAAASPIAVLIEGETGTGKELVARGIHQASERASGPFVAVNCAALPESLLESELFGHKRGAFTGALQDRHGLFEAAHRGTIFLDEIGEMPAIMQAKLLRVLQDGEITPIGDTRPRKVDVRVLSATNRDLQAEIARGAFRQDLFYRLAQFPVKIPPLRLRRDDIALIADRLLGAAAQRHRKQIPGFTGDALRCLTACPWPGNVRQLQNEIERAVALASDGERIAPSHLSAELRDAAAAAQAGDAGTPSVSATEMPAATAGTTGARGMPDGAARDAPLHAAAAGAAAPAEDGSGILFSALELDDSTLLREARDRFESRFIAAVLRREGGNVTRTARALGLSRAMLQRKMRDYALR